MPNKYGYTTINVRPEDREVAKHAKQQYETWSEFLRRAATILNENGDDE